jgi:hypothetical protein
MSPHIKDLLLGTAHVLDIGAILNTPMVYPVILNDEEAIRQDWIAVGNDIRGAIAQYEDKNVEQIPR